MTRPILAEARYRNSRARIRAGYFFLMTGNLVSRRSLPRVIFVM
jgi:hypothetical protein